VSDAPADVGGKTRRDKITALFQKQKKRGLAVIEKYRAIARVNESFYGGDQWSALTMRDGRAHVDKSAWFDTEGVPRIYVNLYTGLLMTWSSLISAGKPTVEAVAATDAPDNTPRAEFAEKLIEYIEGEVDSAVKLDNTIKKGGLAGTAGVKAVYDAEEDKIAWASVSVHDFIIDPNCGEDYKEAGWVIFQDHCSLDEAKDLFDSVGITDKEPTEDPYKNSANEELWGVVREEFWQRPTREFDAGFYACFINDELVEEMDYPIYEDDDSGKRRYLLPACFLKVRNQDGSVYGATNFTDVVPLQRAYNEAVARTQMLIRKGSQAHLKVPEEMGDFDPTKTSIIKFKQANFRAAESIGWTVPPTIQPAIASARDFYGSAMNAVVGLNEATSGRKTTGSMSGRLVEHLVELDQNRNSDVTRSMQEMIIDLYRLSLSLMRQFYVEKRQRAITNSETGDVLDFSSADLDGINVRFQPSSEIDKTQAAKEEDADTRAAAGLAGPTDALRARNAPVIGSSRMVAENLLAAFMKGEELTALPGDLNFEVIDEVIAKHKARALKSHDEGLWVALDQFAAKIKELGARAAELQPVPGEEAGAEPPPPGAP